MGEYASKYAKRMREDEDQAGYKYKKKKIRTEPRKYQKLRQDKTRQRKVEDEELLVYANNS